MQRLNYNQLYYFYVVACEGSIKSACEKLHLTQPTISGQIKLLEENFGFQLFDRKYRKLEVNSLGKEVFKKAEKIFLTGDELMNKLPIKNANYRQDLRIGSVPYLAGSFLEDLTIGLWKDTQTNTHFIHGLLPDLIKMLDEDKIDIVLSDTPFMEMERYNNFNLGEQKLIAIGSPTQESLKEGFPQCLNHKPYLSLQKSKQTQQELEDYFKINNLHPDFIGTSDDIKMVANAVSHQLCFSIVPENSVEEEIENGKVIKLGDIKEVVSNGWAITSAMAGKKLSVRKLLNSYRIRHRTLN